MPEQLDRELLWRQYNLWIDLYKFHMELVLKANGFYFLITGGILTFYFAHPDQPMIRFALVLPALLSILMAVLFLYGSRLVALKRRDIASLAAEMNFQVPPDVNALRVVLWVAASILSLVAGSLLVLMFQ